MKKIAITLLVLGMLSCASSRSTLINEEHTRLEMELKIHLFKTKKALNKTLRKEFPKELRTVEGFAVWYNTVEDYCEIFVTVPKSEFDINTWGHELAHCVFGSWHD